MKKFLKVFFVLLLLLQVHSYWEFKHRIGNFFGEQKYAGKVEGWGIQQLPLPAYLSVEVLFVRTKYTISVLSSKYDEGVQPGWQKMTENEIYKYVRGRSVLGDNTNFNVTNSFYYDQASHEGCPQHSYEPECRRLYVIFDNVLCSFPSGLSIEYSQIWCRPFYKDGNDVFTHHLGRFAPDGFGMNQLTKNREY